jgi:hypothetical protein
VLHLKEIGSKIRPERFKIVMLSLSLFIYKIAAFDLVININSAAESVQHVFHHVVVKICTLFIVTDDDCKCSPIIDNHYPTEWKIDTMNVYDRSCERC